LVEEFDSSGFDSGFEISALTEEEDVEASVVDSSLTVGLDSLELNVVAATAPPDVLAVDSGLEGELV